MSARRLGRDTTSIDSLVWDGRAFNHQQAQAMWLELPDGLRVIAMAELAAGNAPQNIQCNDARSIVGLSFLNRPMTRMPDSANIRVHRSFVYGNYCYDGTFCTYEDVASGGFLAFSDPDYADDV